MIKNPYIGMPIELPEWEEVPCKGCGAGSGGSCDACGNPGGGAPGGSGGSNGSDGDAPGNDNDWQDDGSFDSMYLGSLPIAMCYVPNQRWKTTYPLDQALTAGTLFPELDLPFKGGMMR